jgi:murein DD-endopeptidase MepM/ murein hydrolase activator NlpD
LGLLWLSGWANAAAQTTRERTLRVTYQWPAAGVVTDPFRPPPHRYGPGNRGIEMTTVWRASVRAPAPGVVTFAGQVGGTLWIVIAHSDGIRTTLGRVDEILVTAGTVVEAGTLVAASSGALYFGARDSVGDYLDPMRLLQPDPRPWLVPSGASRR